MRRWVIVAVVVLAGTVATWVLNVSRPGTAVLGCLHGCSTAPERRPGPLRVFSLNVLHGYPGFEGLRQRLDIIADEIRARDADIVCLQEIPWTWDTGSGAQYLALRTGLNHAYLRANGNRFALTFEMGQAILSRFPLRQTSFIELQPRSAYFEARVVLHAVAETPWGEVHAFTTHLTNKEPSVNAAQVDALISYVDAHHAPIAVITGDFNAKPDSVQMRALMDRWTVASPDEATCCIGDLNGGPSERLDERIDYIFLVGGSGIEVDGSERILDAPRRVAGGWQWASDHVGLLAHIRIASRE